MVLPLFVCPQWPLPLVVPPPHAHDPPDMHTSLLSSHPGVERQQLVLLPDGVYETIHESGS